MKFVSKHIRGSAHFLLVFLMDRCSRKPEEHGIGGGFFDGAQHLSKHVPVRLINDKNNPLIPNQFNVVGIIAAVFLNAAHFLNGSDD